MTDPNLRMPAEWEAQSAVQLTWPHEDTDWRPILEEITETYLAMARAIARRQRLLIVTPDTEGTRRLLEQHLTKEELDNTVLYNCPTDDTWARDHAFISLVDRRDRGNIRLLDFCFNGWGRKFEACQDNAINRRLYEDGMVCGLYEDHLDFVLEGGAIESDGEGTIFTTSCCLLAPNRNESRFGQQGDLRAVLEQELKHRLCADRVIWIEHGNLRGDDTDGHIDTLVRLAPGNTLLYVAPGPHDDEQYEGLAKMEEQLKGLVAPDGSGYRLLPLPMPSPIYDEEGERLPATYANFLVVNGAVLCPTYNQPENDAQALRQIALAFPGREMIGIDCRSVIRQHGSLHCCTMQYY